MDKGHTLMTNGTDNHLILWNLRSHKITGSKIEKACEIVSITVNKNTIAGDTSPLYPYGVRIGTPALTTRGLVEKDFEQIAEFLDSILKISLKVQEKSGKMLEDFAKEMEKNEEAKELKKKVEEFSIKFDMPGFDIKTMKYK